ncbi:hypothetical protein LTS18_010562 [Coniosporium uncinatum]|uniref:Uncharacterized protein n=1 Tax=Coniosporium uncinatum TaxID=93489 RepID=A0ACC3DW88_9PEZI|nr:hypothetical protein LTS18_010562 [Coniosporium uncinatum]
MHKVKSTARHAAWRGTPGQQNWNVFGRENSRRSLRSDEESMRPGAPNLPRTQQENHSETCLDGSRELGIAEERDDEIRQGPRHAATMGTGSSPTSATTENAPNGWNNTKDYEKNMSDSENTGRTLVNGNAEDGTRPRKKHHFTPFDSLPLFHRNKKDGDEEATPERTDTDQSKKDLHPITAVSMIRAVLFPQWLTINWLLFCAPIGIALSQIPGIPAIAVFVINFLAIIPLAGILSYATEEIALRVGETLGGLLNASFGNAVELIVGIIALVKGEIIIVQTSLIGSMLSNLLLVLGMCFFFGGLKRTEQFFNITVAQTASSLLALAVGGLLIPTAFTWGTGNPTESNLDEEISYGTAIILLFIYASYLYFQLGTHAAMYNEPSKKVEKNKSSKKEKGETMSAFARAGAGIAGGQAQGAGNVYKQPEEDEEVPELTLIGAIVTLLLSTALVGVCAEFLVDSINEVTCEYHVSQYFVGLILLPIVGNAAEHATAVTVAIKDKMDLAIGVAVGSSMQIALLVLPLMVIIGWIADKDMTLVFDDFQIAVLIVAIWLVNYLIGDGKSHWLEGNLLICLYIIIAVAAWFYPTNEACPTG